MSFQSRCIGTLLFLVLGNEIIFFGMKANGSAHLSPVWILVSGVHLLLMVILLGILAAAALAGTLFILFQIIKTLGNKSEVTRVPLESPEQPVKAPALQSLEVTNARAEAERIEKLKRELEELRKQEAIEARKRRSAEDAADDALDDFL